MYLITTVKVVDGKIDDARTIGYYSELKEAQYSVIENLCDMFEEGFYQYGVITKFKEGLYPDVDQREWYAHDSEDDITYKIDPPEELSNENIYIIG